MPKPEANESEKDFVGRCVPIVLDEGTAEDDSQAAAICHSMWREANEKKSANDRLLSGVKARTQKQSEFNYGILTADRYVKTLLDCVGSDLCNRYASTKVTSFDDILRKASRTLVYSNPDMVLQDSYGKKYRWMDKDGDELTLPKNTLMVFQHCLTSSRKDRDGDILRTQGAQPDPKMLLLWQHIPTLPIGKMLQVVDHNSKKLSVVSVIVDMNELCHDSAVMVDNDMARFSHGFRALEFEKMKAVEGETTSPGGFDVKVFEIMEETIASVPSNVDAEVEEVLLSLVEGGKLTSSILKSVGQTIREHRPKRVNVPISLDLNVTINGKAIGDETNDKSASGAGACGCGSPAGQCTCASEKANEDDEEIESADSSGYEEGLEIEKANGDVEDDDIESAESSEMTEEELQKAIDLSRVKAGRMISAKNMGYLKAVHDDLTDLTTTEGYGFKRASYMMCKECRTRLGEVITEAGGEEGKAGRVLSSGSVKKIQGVRDDLDKMCGYDDPSRGAKAIMERCVGKLDTVLKSADKPDKQDEKPMSARDAMVQFLTIATPEEKHRMLESLKALSAIKKRDEETEKILRLVS